MEKALIVYGSSTGNTEKLAQFIAEELQQRFTVTLKDVVDTQPEDMADQDIIILGSSTWNDGQLQDDFQDFYDELGSIELYGKKAAVFGAGESTWEEFCKAVDIIEAKVRDMHAQVVAPGFKWDGEITDQAASDIKEWARQIH